MYSTFNTQFDIYNVNMDEHEAGMLSKGAASVFLNRFMLIQC